MKKFLRVYNKLSSVGIEVTAFEIIKGKCKVYIKTTPFNASDFLPKILKCMQELKLNVLAYKEDRSHAMYFIV